MSLGTVTQDPSDARIWAVDWSLFLTARSTTIASSSYAIQDGLTKVSETNTTTTATVKVSGGTVGTDYEAVNTVVLANGETVQKTFVVAVREQ